MWCCKAPRVGFFIWYTMKRKLLTIDNLRKRGLVILDFLGSYSLLFDVDYLERSICVTLKAKNVR